MSVQRVVVDMALDRTHRDRDETTSVDRRYVVTCDDCTFEEEVYGVDDAQSTALDHRDSTDHEVLAVEVPATS